MKRRFMGSKHKDAGYMKVVALEDGLTVSFSNPLEYSFDEITWQSLPANTGTPAINKDQYVAFKANLTPNSPSGIGTFSIDKQCDLKGNCMSLLFGDDFSDKIDLTGYNYAFCKLFYDQKAIKSVNPGFLPATTLADSCYNSMFYSCTNLTTTPELPATTLADNCYSGMFSSCTSLTTAPSVLPATTLASNCYGAMFLNCTSLTTAPELPATMLASNCYGQMFLGCIRLTISPELPATTLASSCYASMFAGCKNLTISPELPATTLASNCYGGMFSSCTSLTTAPELPATTLAQSCYGSMFSGCTNLTKAPELPATTLADNCYKYIFRGCSSLTTAPELPATTLVDNCYNSMFYGCKSLTTAPELPATTLARNCYNNMFYGCSDLTTVPTILPATTLVSKCYYGMFRDCSSLTTAPELPATTLVDNCYYMMFYGCTNLNYIKALFTTTPDSSYTANWVKSISSTGTFVKSKDATWDVTGDNGVPNGWTVLKGDPDYMKVVALEDDLTVSFTNPLEYSLDGTTWQSLPAGKKTPTINKDQYVSFRAKLTPNSSSGIGTFSIDKQCGLKGNCMSLLFGNNFVDKVDLTGYNYAFCKLFYNQKAIKSVNPGFLPATTLKSYCYAYMFSGCTSLTTAPELPATTLARNCYNNMFYGCTSLTKAPELPATTLVDSCYQYMFNGCTNLNYIKALFTTTPDYGYTSNWVNGVSSTGTFVKSKDATWNVTGKNGVPAGWTVEIAIDYEFVDLGLPSGTKWSTRNLGALDVNDVGLYYQNGGEQGYKVVLEWYRGSYTIVSSEPDGFNFSTYNISEFKDAANIINKDMSIPSVEDWNELVDNGTFTYDGTNTVYTSNINGNTIIFPRNSVLSNGHSIEYFGLYCSLSFSIHGLNAFCVYDPDCMGAIAEDASTSMDIPIQSGMPIRPVTKVV